MCVTTSSWTYGLSAQEERYGENEAAPTFLYLFVLEVRKNDNLAEAVPFETILGVTIILLIRKMVELGRLLHMLSVFVLIELRIMPTIQKFIAFLTGTFSRVKEDDF